jgi:ribosome-associated protein
MLTSEALVELAVDALEDLKAFDIQVLDVRGMTSIADFMVIASGNSSRQVQAMVDHVLEKAKERGFVPLGSEGRETGEWVLLDLGDVIVHAMHPTARLFYQLEKLWSDGRQGAYQQAAAAQAG